MIDLRYKYKEAIEDIKNWLPSQEYADEYFKKFPVETTNEGIRAGREDTHIEPSNEIKTKDEGVSVACSG